MFIRTAVATYNPFGVVHVSKFFLWSEFLEGPLLSLQSHITVLNQITSKHCFEEKYTNRYTHTYNVISSSNKFNNITISSSHQW